MKILIVEDEKLLADLYALRKRLASKQKIPAYLVFSDATLREMVQKKPFSTDELLNITGVGEKKAAKLMIAYKTKEKLREATPEQLASVAGVNADVAQELWELIRSM